MNPLGRCLLRFGRQNPAVILLHLMESKHIMTHRGPNVFKDNISMMHSMMIPNVSNLQRAAHQSAKSKLDGRIKNFGSLARTRARQLLNRDAPPNLVIRDVKEELRKLYHEAYALGLKGSTTGLHPSGDIISPEDRRWVDSAFTHEMRFFNNFLDQISSGEVTLPQIDNRIEMYLNAVRGVYDSGRVIGSHPNSLIYWVYNPEAHHCMSCLYLRDHSPYTKRTIPTTPRAGATECLSNCKCHLRIQIADAELVKQIDSKAISRSAHLTYLNQLKNRRTRTTQSRHRTRS